MGEKTASRRPTIRDVAAEAQVSTSTVSLYIQGDRRVSNGTGEKVAAAIKKLGYVPRSRGRAARRSTLFALLIEDYSLSAFPDALYGGIIHALEARAKRAGLGMLLAMTGDDQVLRILQEQQAGGVIILGGCPANDALAATLHARQIPLVLVDNYIPGLFVDSIVPDNYWGSYAAFQHLVELGHRRIAVIQGPPKYKTLTDRLWGALRAAADAGIDVPDEYCQPSISSGFPNKGYREMGRLLGLEDPPTAVFAISDKAARGALEAIKEAGLRVPDDISLVGFDDEAFSAHLTPALTTVRLDMRRLGELAVEQLVKRMNGDGGAPARIDVFNPLVIRESTASCRAD